MKKIIELAEKVLYYAGYSLTLSYDEATEYLACRDKLKQTLAARRQLEQTPITEEWLKEHGWVFDYTIEESVADYHYVTCNGYIKKGRGLSS